MILGNAFLDYASAFAGYEHILCSEDLDLGDDESDSVELPILTEKECVRLGAEVKECQRRQKQCTDIQDRYSAQAREVCKGRSYDITAARTVLTSPSRRDLLRRKHRASEHHAHRGNVQPIRQ